MRAPHCSLFNDLLWNPVGVRTNTSQVVCFVIPILINLKDMSASHVSVGGVPFDFGHNDFTVSGLEQAREIPPVVPRGRATASASLDTYPQYDIKKSAKQNGRLARDIATVWPRTAP